MQLLAADPGVVEDARGRQSIGMNRRLHSLAGIDPDFTGISAADPLGVIWATSNTGPNARLGVSLADEPYFQQVLIGANTAIGEPRVGAATEKPVVPLAVPVLDADGRILGILQAGLSLERLSTYMGSVEIGRTGYASLLTNDGIFLTSPNPTRILTTVGSANEAVAEARRGRPAIAEIVNFSGVPVLAAASPISSLGWIVQVQLPRDEAFELTDQLARRAAITAAAVLLVTLALSIVAARVATAAVIRLQKASEHWATGELTYQADVRGSDELAQLGHAFNGMAASLRTTQQQNQDLVDELAASLKDREAAVQRAVEELRQSELRAQAIIDGALDAVITMDDDGRITGWNPKAEEIFAWRRDEVIGRSFIETISPEREREAHTRGLMRFIERDERSRVGRRLEINALLRSGNEIPVEISVTAVPIGDGRRVFSAFVRDISLRKQAEQARAHLAAIVQSSDDAIIGGTLDGIVTAWNSGAERLYGYTAAEMIGRPISLLVPPKEHDQMMTNRDRMHQGERFQHDETVRLHKDGRRLDVSITISPIRNDEGEITGAASISRDISARKLADLERERLLASEQAAKEELLRAQSQLVQQERLRALGEMASGVAHDFNNALSPIVGYGELLLMRPELWEDQNTTTQYLQWISTAAQDAANVVNRLREFYRAREQGEDFEDVDLPSLVTQVVDLTRPKWKDQAQARGLQIDVQAHLAAVPPVDGHPAELREMLTNLVFNAVDALPDGGAITITTREDRGKALLLVSDTGVGMSDEARQRCLEPFFTTKGDRGTGLGLAMVYGIIQRHSGELDIKSTEGHGTTFSIRLPLSTRVSAKEADDGSGAVRSLRVLIVDDDPKVSEVTAAYFSFEGHTTETVGNGMLALKRFEADRFDLVITDQAMRGMSGEQLATAIKEISPATPIIMLTGFGALMRATGTKPAGVDWLVSKPATPSDLQRAVAGVMRS